jgi:tRNA uridine 5-carboxymethylaminomethyl modification enzyme
MRYDEKFDVIVIGAGHAGCEAASAAARIGAQTALITLNLDLIGQMSCNPAIGGIAKGHLVREIDALGGIMGRVIDRTGIQFRLLNRSRGPAVQAPRAQADRTWYRLEMRRLLEGTPNLHLRQGLVIGLIVENQRIQGVELQDTRRLMADAVVIATGTFLNGLIHTGTRSYTAGRAGEPASIDLAENLKQLGFRVGRLKTGTPPRLDARTIDFAAFEEQPPDEQPVPFSFSTEGIEQPQVNCFIGYTSDVVHQQIRANLHQSPLYSGKIKGVGPRYCPSIEDKVVKFPEKNRHQLFLEPEGHDTNEVYLNGFSTSMPADLQQDLVHSIKGLESAAILRPGYAIEYDYVDPRELTPYLETTKIKGLFHAGQINGTTGYEEAACQGLVAGINAALSSQNREGLRISRETSYMGVLVDDLISQGVDEPYRMFTSRSEYRLALRYDTADSRLSPIGRDLGLLGDTEWEKFNSRQSRLSRVRALLEGTRYKRSDPTYQEMAKLLGSDLGDAFTLAQLAHRPGVSPNTIRSLISNTVSVTNDEFHTALADTLYSGYIDSQRNNHARLNSHDSLQFRSNFDFAAVNGLSNEMVERLKRAQPENFGQAKRIPGITPAALSNLLVHLKFQHA